ncbi:MAG: DUF4153 domain-containing protein [Bacteroidaceae bacterium]|nr:DUF4153 domain-containing protein [Bacteroidaceae bacterium]
MNLKSYPRIITEIFRHCIDRFPVAVAYITALTVLLLININEEDLFSERLFVVLSYYLSVGYMLSLTLHLWQEETTNKYRVIAVNVVAHLILIVDAVYLYSLPESQTFLEQGISHAAAILALWLSMFFLSFLKEKDNVASWNFAMRLVSQFAVSHVVGFIMFGGLSLLTASFSHLFGMDIDGDCYANLSVLFCLYLPSLLFLGLIPHGEAKHDRTPAVSKFMNGVMHYLFLPLIGCYLLVLYVYACRILYLWKLPDGWVSWLVVALMAGCIGVELGLYPARKKEHKRFDEFIARWLPMVILPLLVLMTIGIVRRFHDYGISINRLYLATLNAWFYMVCIGLFITRAKRINWITISFSAIFLITSALPVNYVSITHKVIFHSIKNELLALGAKNLPLSKEEYREFMNKIPEEKAEMICSRLEYMVSWFGRESVADIADKDIYFWSSWQHADSASVSYSYANYSAYIEEKTEIEIPKGYSRMLNLEYESTKPFACDYDGIVKFVVSTENGGENDTIYMNIKQIKQIEQPYRTPVLMRCSSSGSVFMLMRYDIPLYKDDKNTRLEFSGWLFKK